LPAEAGIQFREESGLGQAQWTRDGQPLKC